MDWNRSYSSSWRIFRVNRKTWADGELITNIDSASVTRTADGSLLETGNMRATGDFEPDYYRIVLTAQQGGDVERVDVATLLFAAEKGEYDYGTTQHNVNGRSVLYPASTTAVVTGGYAPQGADGVQYCRELLEDTINAPVETEGGFVLSDHIVHQLGSSVLDAVWDVLDAGNYVMQIDGRGVVHILPKPTEPSLVIENASRGMLENGIDYDMSMSEIPNRYIVIEDNNITIATNDREGSPVSTINRGYAVDEVDTSPVLIDGETMSEYALRRLMEESVVKDSRTYQREYAPNVNLYSIIRASLYGLEGDLRVKSQAITCEHGISLKEKAEREISVW